MSAIRLLRAADRRPQPWKNGGGETREICVFPPDAGLDDFEWRVSTAIVGVAGAFSRFAEADRILSLLEGTLELRVDAQPPVRLDVASPPFHFAGDEPTLGTPLSGFAVDLNVIYRRATWTARVARACDADFAWRTGSVIVFALSDGTVDVSGATLSLSRHDALLIDRVESVAVGLNEMSDSLLIAIEPR